MKRIIQWIKTETVLAIALLLALVSMAAVPPSKAYAGYVDWSVLEMLFCLMAVVAGFMKEGVFGLISQKLLSRVKQVPGIACLLVCLCFFSAMLVTNDVALIALVPLTIGILRYAGQKILIFTIVMETVAANLGSMATPIGNPQNLFLFSYYQMSPADFFATVLPIAAVSLVLILAAMKLVRGGELELSFQQQTPVGSKGKIVCYLLLFAVCLAAVLRVIPHWMCFVIVLIALLVIDRSIYKRVDYGLLMTFLCFFVFVGNLGQIPELTQWLSQLVNGREELAGVLASQVISNVPAALMLSAFTDQSRELLLGVNIGGLGTLVASLASLISFQQYRKSQGAQTGKYFLCFTAVNVVFLILLGSVSLALEFLM